MGYQFSMDMGTGGQEGLGSWKAFVDVFVGAFFYFSGAAFLICSGQFSPKSYQFGHQFSLLICHPKNFINLLPPLPTS